MEIESEAAASSADEGGVEVFLEVFEFEFLAYPEEAPSPPAASLTTRPNTLSPASENERTKHNGSSQKSVAE